MNVLLSKVLVLIGGTSVAIGGGVLAWHKGIFSSSKSIKDKLLSENYKILESRSSEWTNIFSKYNDAGNKDWKFEGTISTTEDLKNTCKKIIEEKEEKQDLYKSVTKWCVVPRKAEEFVNGLLDTGNGKDGEAWGRVLTEYKKTKVEGTSNPIKYAMDGVSITDPSSGGDATNITALQTGCTTRKAKLTYELDFDNAVKEMGEWCVDKKVG